MKSIKFRRNEWGKEVVFYFDLDLKMTNEIEKNVANVLEPHEPFRNEYLNQKKNIRN
jgi:hypothetical protein